MNLMPVDLKADFTPLVRSLANIVNSTHKGVAKLSGLCMDRALADAFREQLLRNAQNTYDAESIKRGEKRFEDGVLLDVLPLPVQPGDDNIVNLIADAIKREEIANLIKALDCAAERLKDIPPHMISDEPIQKTFFNRWRKEVESVDDEQLRVMWAQIIACEVASPQSISLRTLDVLRNLSLKEARIFQEMLKGEIEGCIPIDDHGHAQYCSYADALMLQDVGLLFAHNSQHHFPASCSLVEKKKGTVALIPSMRLMACLHKENFALHCYFLTDAGRCLLRIAQGTRTLDDIKNMFAYISEQSNKVEISLHMMQTAPSDGIRWDPIPLWSSKPVKSQSGNSK